jgi:hypothetical protein
MSYIYGTGEYICHNEESKANYVHWYKMSEMYVTSLGTCATFGIENE